MNEGRWAAAVAIGSRLLLMAVAVVTAAVIGVRSRALFLRDPAHAEVLEGFAKRLFEPWAHWDGVWFVRIAADGYAAYDFSPAFFPLYPLMMRVLAPLTAANYVIAGVLISLACYAAAMLLLVSIGARRTRGAGRPLERRLHLALPDGARVSGRVQRIALSLAGDLVLRRRAPR